MIKIAGRQQFSIPAYKRVEEDLRTRVRNGQWQIGAMLPSRKALAEQYGVNLETVQRGIGALIADGTLRADNRRGTFVAQITPVTIQAPLSDLALYKDKSIESSELTATRTPLALVGLVSDIRLARPGQAVSVHHLTIAAAVESEVAALGGTTRLMSLNQPGKEDLSIADAIRLLIREGVNAIVVQCDPVDEEAATVAVAANIPIVFITMDEIRYPVACVYYDNRDAGQVACRHLMQAGYQNILFISPGTALWVEQRLVGAREAMILTGKPTETLRAFIDDSSLDPISDETGIVRVTERGLEELFARGGTLIGIIASNDQCAIAFIEAAAKQGLLAGRDFGIVAFDDTAEARLVGLTTLRPPLQAMGQEAVKILRESHGGETRKRVCLHSDLVTRVSSSPRIKINTDYLPTRIEYLDYPS